jgi:lipopolysaccharide transport system ATP-binding protein
MQDISKTQGRTVLFVSHNMAAVKSLCTKGIVLEHGGITFSGSSDDAINYYLENSYKKSEIKLSDRIDRKGNKKLIINEIYVKNKDEVIVGEMHSGEYYKIIFEYEKKKEIDPKQLTIVLQFKNENDELFTTIATDELGFKFSEVKDKGSIEVEIPRLQFREGRYTLHYMVSEKLSFNTPHQIIDYLQDAFTLNVIRGDYWNSGVLNRPKGFIQEAFIKLV